MGEVDETTLRPQWAGRPRVGDTVRDPRAPSIGDGEVIATFYRNGEGGMHVTWSFGTSWACCHNVVIVTRGERPV